MAEIVFSDDFGKEFCRIEEKSRKGSGDAEYMIKIINKGIANCMKSTMPASAWRESSGRMNTG